MATTALAANPGDNRWFYCSRRVAHADDVAFVSNLVTRAAAAGFNGMLYAGGLDHYVKWSAVRKANFQAVRRFCQAKGIEIVPLVWSPGYGTLNGFRSDLVETVQLKDVPHVVRNGKIVFEETEKLTYENAGFEEYDEKRRVFPHWMTERPGVCSFQDFEIKHSGKASVRLEPNRDGKHQARVMQRMKVKPHHRYRYSMWIKYKDIPKSFGALRIEVYSGKQAPCGYTGVLIPRSDDGCRDWTKVTCEITADETGMILAYMGTWCLKSGTFWIDDVAIEEIGFREIGGRPAPFAVRDVVTGQAYREGVDYVAPRPARDGLNILPTKGQENLSFSVPAGSALADGTRVLVDAYVPSRNGGKQQRSTCMSDPLVFAAMRESAAGIQEACAPRKWFLSTDEVRNFNTCPSCQARQTDAGQLLGGFITEAMKVIRAQNPRAEVYGWADMFLPMQNGKGQFADSWRHVPKDFIMCDWSQHASGASVGFLADQGFSVICSVCLDGAPSAAKAESCADWLSKTANPRGLIFTTWVNDYRLLEQFGKIGNGERKVDNEEKCLRP